MQPEKILIELIELEHEVPTDIIEAYIILTDDYLHYQTEFYGNFKNPNDDQMPADNDAYSYLCEIISKEHISGIYLNWKRKPQNWQLVISTAGVQTDVVFFFNDYRKAKDFFFKLKTWKYPGSYTIYPPQ